MITMITGGPGMGKSALAVELLRTKYADRPIFSNINGLTLDHSPLPKLEEWTEERLNDQGTVSHHFTFPAGAIVVIDECQQFFRPRSTGSKVPPYVSAFETHRHGGLDFILITQGSRLVDSNLRSLLKGGLHIFLKSSYVGRFRYEKSECINEDDKASYGLASKRRYKLPKTAFNLYKSAELHTKPPRAKLPLAAFVVVAAVILSGVLTWRASDRIGSAIAGADESLPLAESSSALDVPEARPRAAVALASVSSVPARMIEALTPVDPHNPLSAPLYAPVAPPVVAPQVVGCISMGKRCTCYTQQSTPVWLPDEQCRARASGQYYDPYRPTPSPESQTNQANAPRQGGKATAPQGFEPLPVGDDTV